MKTATDLGEVSVTTTGVGRVERGKVKKLFEHLREEIHKQRLKPGDKLPASRHLSKQLGISRNGVTTAFDMLAAEGLVAGRVGAGTFVSGDTGAHSGDRSESETTTKLFSNWAQNLPLKPHILPSLAVKIDFRPGRPNRLGLEASLTPMRRAIGRLSRLDFAGPDANDPAGRLRLRNLLANHLRITRGLACEPSDILLTSGTHQSLDLIARLFTGNTATISVEDPCYPLVPKLFQSNGYSISPTAVDDEGIVVSQIDPDARLIYVTPNHQFPLGYRLSAKRRIALLNLAAVGNAFVVEDDYDGELYSAGNYRTCLKADDQKDRVIYLGSLSKYLFPQLRLGFIVAPKVLRDTLVRAHWLTDRQVSLPIQLCLESLLENGDFIKIVRRSERDYQTRTALLCRLIHDRLSSHFTVSGSSHGFQVTALAASGFDVKSYVHSALSRGVGIYSLTEFTLNTKRIGLVFGLADLSEDEITEGVDILRSLLPF